ncbi:MAG TPA: 3-hydroxyacyl-CoA dehydrogenase [Gammaproteobacteria bacterium]|nr:3-hydroxyacyl-CoA dehydrogenase [Gammaproteobacteria bacterium]
MALNNFASESLTIGIIGAGIMGRGIAQLAASAGITAIIHDIDAAAVADAGAFIAQMIDKAKEKGRLSEADSVRSKSCVRTTTALSDLSGADMIIEAIVEKLEVKQAVFREMETLVSPDCILATNTSSLSVTAIAAACAKPGRVVGCHFFNPVPLMKLVEIIGGMQTDPAVIEKVQALVERLGHTPVQVKDAPGFLVNHLGRGMNTEGLRVLSEGVAAPHQVDEIMRECAGFRMGPFELMDLTALDVTCPVSEQVYAQYYQEPRLRPTPELRLRLSAGILGRKTGAGFYRYVKGEKILPEEPSVPPLPATARFWISPMVEGLAGQVSGLLQAAGIGIDEGEVQGADSIAIVTPLGQDATTIILEEHLDPGRTVAVDALFCGKGRITLMGSPATRRNVIDAAWAAFAAAGLKVTVIRDSAGLVAQRMVANIVNTACDIAQEGVAGTAEIDTAARLGLGYPEGPLAMGDRIGAGMILEILENMQVVYGDPRYRPSPWLRRRAMLGLPLLHEEQI